MASQVGREDSDRFYRYQIAGHIRTLVPDNSILFFRLVDYKVCENQWFEVVESIRDSCMLRLLKGISSSSLPKYCPPLLVSV